MFELFSSICHTPLSSFIWHLDHFCGITRFGRKCTCVNQDFAEKSCWLEKNRNNLKKFAMCTLSLFKHFSETFFVKNRAFNLTLCLSVCLSVLTCVSKNLFPFSNFAQTWHKNHNYSNKNSGKRIRVVRLTGPETQGPEKTKIKALWKVQREENGGQ